MGEVIVEEVKGIDGARIFVDMHSIEMRIGEIQITRCDFARGIRSPPSNREEIVDYPEKSRQKTSIRTQSTLRIGHLEPITGLEFAVMRYGNLNLGVITSSNVENLTLTKFIVFSCALAHCFRKSFHVFLGPESHIDCIGPPLPN